MATNNDTTQDPQDFTHVVHAVNELHALADTLERAIGGGVPPGDDAPETVARMVLDRAITVRDIICSDSWHLQPKDGASAEPATAAAQTDLVDSRAWDELHECRHMCAVLRQALDADIDSDPSHQHQARVISSKLGHAMELLEVWANGWDKANTGGGAA